MKKLLGIAVLLIVVYYGIQGVTAFFNKVDANQSNVDKTVTKQVDSMTIP